MAVTPAYDIMTKGQYLNYVYTALRMNNNGAAWVATWTAMTAGFNYSLFGVPIYHTVTGAPTVKGDMCVDAGDSDKLKYYDGSSWVDLTGGGASTFIALTDTPASYAGAANEFVRVNSAGNALLFDTPNPGITALQMYEGPTNKGSVVSSTARITWQSDAFGVSVVTGSNWNVTLEGVMDYIYASVTSFTDTNFGTSMTNISGSDKAFTLATGHGSYFITMGYYFTCDYDNPNEDAAFQITKNNVPYSDTDDTWCECDGNEPQFLIFIQAYGVHVGSVTYRLQGESSDSSTDVLDGSYRGGYFW